jgi:hypothetical protein
MDIIFICKILIISFEPTGLFVGWMICTSDATSFKSNAASNAGSPIPTVQGKISAQRL